MDRRGFTLIEMIVTIAILVIFASLLVPVVAKQRQLEQVRSFGIQVATMADFAKQEAIQNRVVSTLTYDQSNNQLTVNTNQGIDPNQPGLTNQGSGGSSMTGTNLITNPNSTSQNSNPTLPSLTKSLTLPSGWQGQQFMLDGQSVNSSDWKVNFNPDGSSDSATIDFQFPENGEKSVLIDAFGRITVLDGPPPDPTTLQWQGGSIAQRQATGG